MLYLLLMHKVSFWCYLWDTETILSTFTSLLYVAGLPSWLRTGFWPLIDPWPLIFVGHRNHLIHFSVFSLCCRTTIYPWLRTVGFDPWPGRGFSHAAVFMTGANTMNGPSMNQQTISPPNLNSSMEMKPHGPLPDPDSVKMFVGQIPKTMTEEQLRPMFEEFGPVYHLNVLRKNNEHAGKLAGTMPMMYL